MSALADTILSEVISARIEHLEAALLPIQEAHGVECALTHEFAPHVYCRTITMPQGTFVIGHQHRTRHFNIVHRGHALVYMDGAVHEIIAPCRFISEPGVRKVLYILEECEWSTMHPTDTTDLAELEEELIVKSQSFLGYSEMAALRSVAERRLL